jgi:hypothetical protein
MRIGFLFNHDQIHQVAHSLPIAIALARGAPDADIVVATTNARLSAEVIRLGEGLIGSRIRLLELGLTRWSSRVPKGGFESLIPAVGLLIYRDNLDFFRSLDLLVVTERTSLSLKTRFGLKDLRIVHARPGAGDRADGFDKASAGFDLVLCSGPKVRERLIADAGVDPERIAVVGYPKFDAALAGDAHPIVEDGRPVVLYNPHVAPHLTSWYSIGRKVLDWFVEHDDHQLIFAPHVMLFERPFVVSIDKRRLYRPGRIEERYHRAPNIHIDLGSRASTTMAYTNRADVYLGDASSQVYEFLRRPRCCIFLNPHGFGWRQDRNFAHWKAGRVIGTAHELREALAEAPVDHDGFHRARQEAMFVERIDLTDDLSSVRAARAVASFAGLSAAGLASGQTPALPVARPASDV